MPVLPELTAQLLREWEALGLPPPRPRRINYMGIAGSVEGGTTTFLAFGDREQPCFAVKIHRDADAEERVRAEVETLEYLRERAERLAGPVPRPVRWGRVGRRWVLATSAVAGRPMRARVRNDGRPDLAAAQVHLEGAALWLAQLRAATTDEVSSAAELVPGAQRAIAEFSRSVELVDDERRYLAGLAHVLPAMARCRAFVQHGDFSPHNILVDGPRLAVIDWTESARGGFALHDLFFFVTSYFLQLRRDTGAHGITAAFADTYLDASEAARLVRDVLLRYCDELGGDAEMLEPLFGLFLVEQNVREGRKLKRCSRLGSWPYFALHLAAAEGLEIERIAEAQPWRHFFRQFVARRQDFLGRSERRATG